MANLLGKKARVYLDDLDIYLRSFEMEQGLEARTADAAKFGDDWETTEVIRGSGRFTVNAYLDDVYSQGDPGSPINNALDLVLWKLLTGDTTPPVMNQTPANLTFLPIPTPIVGSDGAIFTRGFGQFSIAPANNGLVAARIQLLETGPINRGKILAIGNITINSGSAHDGAEVAFTAPVGFTRASFHVFSITGAAGTFTVKVQSDTTGFPSPTDQITFPTFTTMASGYVELVGANSDGFLRANVTSDNVSNSTLGIIVVGHTS